jgi:photosystem II stability/assembly factor-like uncharacterized protein
MRNVLRLVGAIACAAFVATAAVAAWPHAAQSRVYRSTDGGRTWAASAEGLPEDVTVNTFMTSGGRVFAGTEAHGLFISKDGGRTWTAAIHGLEPGEKVDALAADHVGVWAGTARHGVFLSRDDGGRWAPASDGLTGRAVRSLAHTARGLLAATNDGIFASDDGKGSWTRLTEGPQVNALAVQGEHVYAGGVAGLRHSPDGGRTWKSMGDFGRVHNVSADGASVFVTLYDNRVLRTDDGGGEWKRADGGLPPKYTFQVLGLGGIHLAAQWTGVYVSSNRGELWTPVPGIDQAVHELARVDRDTLLAASALLPSKDLKPGSP